MIDWFKETFSFVDSELLMMIGIAIIAIILLKVLFKVLYRFRILKVIIAVGIIGSVLYMALNYVETHKDIFSNETNYYIYGQAGFISNTVRTLEVESNKTNFHSGGKGRMIVKVPINTKIISSNNKDELKLDDLSVGDVLQIYCEENNLSNGTNEVTAVKIIKKYDK